MIFVTHLTGKFFFKSPLNIIKVGEVIGAEMLGGLRFTGLNESYFEEIPGIIIKNGILGLQISIQEIEPCDEFLLTKFVFSIVPIHSTGDIYPMNHGKLDYYLYSLFEKKFKNSNEIIPIFDF